MAISLDPNKTPLADSAREAILAEPGFGKYFTDNMVTSTWSSSSGWSPLRLTAYGPLSMDPATMVLHYGQEIFEGLKAYRQPDGGIAVFRPGQNAKRFARSATRMALPALPEELFLESVHALVSQDQNWVPARADESLYLRPMMIATEVGLGVRPSSKAEYILIASPAGAYFKGICEGSPWRNRGGQVRRKLRCIAHCPASGSG
jgi:branched-chain amino acid aminotransferase